MVPHRHKVRLSDGESSRWSKRAGLTVGMLDRAQGQVKPRRFGGVSGAKTASVFPSKGGVLSVERPRSEVKWRRSVPLPTAQCVQISWIRRGATTRRLRML